MGSIPAGNVHKGTRRAKTGRQTYVSLLTHMSVFPFLYGDANDREREAFEVQRLVPNYRASARDEKRRSLFELCMACSVCIIDYNHYCIFIFRHDFGWQIATRRVQLQCRMRFGL